MSGFSELCVESGLARDEICEVLGVPDDVLEDYRRGRKKPSPREFQILRGFSLANQHNCAPCIDDKSAQSARADLPLALATKSKPKRWSGPSTSGTPGNLVLNTSPTLPFAERKDIGLSATGKKCALEDDAFPFEALSDVCEAESWRKEINRPLTHIHKWWAQRLGTVFRAMVIGAMAPSGADVLKLFYARTNVQPDTIVFDPFMGSGTTLCEAIKLGARTIGRDINPVSHFLVKNAVSDHDRTAILRSFREVERDVSSEIRSYYITTLADGATADVLYYFWVKQAACPSCEANVDLFSSYVFAQHAYAKLHPDAQIVCTACGEVNCARFDSRDVTCCSCGTRFDPQYGPASGKCAQCKRCGNRFLIAEAIRAHRAAPQHRLYAKLVLTGKGEKVYLKASGADIQLYESAERRLKERHNAFPTVPIQPGYNTNQALGYNYRYWHEMFNARQLLCISILADRIRQIERKDLREIFACLLSGTLEFNNMFASYKGEGTGAVRHMFAHHILKPERVPLEANLWGTPKSSGSFSTLFESRICRALDYADNPFELRIVKRKGKKSTEKVYGLSDRIGHDLAVSFDEFKSGRRTYISCGGSAKTDIPDNSVDAVLSDPPFFDNVHYSQLADFFYVWQRHILTAGCNGEQITTRSDQEVQTEDAGAFTERLTAVFLEAHRVLKANGVFAFTYHHSRADGWRAVLRAVMDSGFVITAAHPIKSEMSVAMPKLQAKEPIDLDIILVCRKLGSTGDSWSREIVVNAATIARQQIRRLRTAGRHLSRNDIRVILMSQLLRAISSLRSADEALTGLEAHDSEIEALISRFALGEEVVQAAE